MFAETNYYIMSELPENTYIGGNVNFNKPEEYSNVQNENYQTASFISNESNANSQQTNKYETMEVGSVLKINFSKD